MRKVRDCARLTATVVFPVPPFPLAIERIIRLQSRRHVPPSEQGGLSHRSVAPQQVVPFEDALFAIIVDGVENIF